MGARLVVSFTDGEKPGDIEPVAHVYLHWGGETLAEIDRTVSKFLTACDELSDKRFNVPRYLAAKLVVHEYTQNHYASKHPLDFLSIGIVDSAEYGDGHAVICCGDVDPEGGPAVYIAGIDGPANGYERLGHGRVTTNG